MVHDSPQVGENLREHRLAVLQHRLDGPGSHNRYYSGLPFLWQALVYLLTRKGMMARPPHEVGAFVRTRRELERPDAQLLLAPVSFDLERFPLALERAPGISCVAYALRPESRGSVTIVAKGAGEPPAIRPNYLAAPEDRRALLGAVRTAREYFRQPPLAAQLGPETVPGPEVKTDDELIDALARQGGCGFHAVGTCATGKHARAVLDERLRVRGAAGLRVIDASAFPFMISGNLNAPVMALAWRGAELVLEDSGH